MISKPHYNVPLPAILQNNRSLKGDLGLKNGDDNPRFNLAIEITINQFGC
jgi:hypothetical protein